MTKVVHYHTKDSATVIKDRWWLEPENEKHTHITAIVARIKQSQDWLYKRNLYFAQLYENQQIRGFGAGLYHSPIAPNNQTQRLTINLIKSCTDTLVSRLGTAKPRPMAITEDGNWVERKRAEKLTSYLEGLYSEIGMWKKGRLALRDSCILGMGVLKLHNSTGKIGVDRIVSDEIVVDNTEAIYGEPRQLHQCRYINRDVVLGMFPGAEDLIKACPSGIDPAVANGNSADMLLVTESWHLPSYKGATDGIHCITINNATLYEEPWVRSWFPFLFLPYSERLMGFYPMGLAEEISGIQLEVNKMLRTIAIAQHLACQPQTWLDIASKSIIGNSVDNEIGGVKFYAGAPPIFSTGAAMPGEYYSHLENLIAKAYNITGVSQLSAQGHKPAGLNSGIALRTVQDIESDRFKWTSQKYDEMFLTAAEMIVDLNEELYAKDPKLAVKVESKKGMQRINWKDVRMDIDSYTMRLFPTSLLPSQPEGKFEKVQEMLQAGMVDKEEGTQLLDFPDIQAVTSLKLSPREIILKILGEMIEYGRYQSPEPYMNLSLAKELAQLMYLKCRVDRVPQQRLDLILEFMADVDALVDKAAEQAQEEAMNQQMAMQQAMAPGAPIDDPAAAPLGRPEQLPIAELMPMQ